MCVDPARQARGSQDEGLTHGDEEEWRKDTAVSKLGKVTATWKKGLPQHQHTSTPVDPGTCRSANEMRDENGKTFWRMRNTCTYSFNLVVCRLLKFCCFSCLPTASTHTHHQATITGRSCIAPHRRTYGETELQLMYFKMKWKKFIFMYFVSKICSCLVRVQAVAALAVVAVVRSVVFLRATCMYCRMCDERKRAYLPSQFLHIRWWKCNFPSQPNILVLGG